MNAPFRPHDFEELHPDLRRWADRERSITFMEEIESDIADDLRAFDRCILAGVSAGLLIALLSAMTPAIMAWWQA